MAKVKTLLQATYLPEAECDVCDFRASDTTAREEAKAHTLGTGHMTRVTYETTTVYGREDS
jgi:hypothetical protein